MEQNIELRKEISDLLKFAITLNVFFVSVIGMITEYSNMVVEQAARAKLGWAASIAVLMFSFIMVNIFPKEIGRKASLLKTVKGLLLAELFFFIPPIILLAQNPAVTTLVKVIFSVSIYCLAVIPVILLLILFFGWVVSWFKRV